MTLMRQEVTVSLTYVQTTDHQDTCRIVMFYLSIIWDVLTRTFIYLDGQIDAYIQSRVNALVYWLSQPAITIFYQEWYEWFGLVPIPVKMAVQVNLI